MRQLSRLALTTVAALLVRTAAAEAQREYVNGLFLNTPQGIVELIAYAEPRSAGQLQMVQGDLEDAPTVHEVRAILSSLQFWTPVGVVVTTTHAFSDDRAERRVITIVRTQLNVFTTGVRASDLERREKIESVLRAVGASPDRPGYGFVIMTVDKGHFRYYPFRLTPDER